MCPCTGLWSHLCEFVRRTCLYVIGLMTQSPKGKDAFQVWHVGGHVNARVRKVLLLQKLGWVRPDDPLSMTAVPASWASLFQASCAAKLAITSARE